MAIKLTIPVSISLQIIFGYIFYSFAATQIYIYFFFPLMIALNLLIFRKIWLTDGFFKVHFPPRKKFIYLCLIIMLLIPILFYVRYYDSLHTLAPGQTDTYNHIQFIKFIENYGYIKTTAWYAPGFHILVYPLTAFLRYSDIYRFLGPTLSLVSLIGIYLLFSGYLRTTISRVFFISLFISPVFNQLNLQMMGFFSSSLTFLMLAAMIFLSQMCQFTTFRKPLIIFIIITAALSITVPYFFISLFPAYFLLTAASLLFKKKIVTRYFLLLTLALLIGIFLSLGSVMLQTKVHNNTSSFPKIPIVSIKNGNIDISSNTKGLLEIQNIQNMPINLLRYLPDNMEKIILQLYFSATDLLNIKQIRPLNNMLAIGAYIWIIISMLMFYYSIKTKSSIILTLSALSVVYGLSTQTGLLELSRYKGRSGWYLLLLCFLSIGILFDRANISKMKHASAILIMILLMSSILFPPTYYRSYFTDHLADLKSIVNMRATKIIVATTSPYYTLVHDNIIYTPLSDKLLSKEELRRGSLIILEKTQFPVDPNLSQQNYVFDKDLKFFNSSLRRQNEKRQKLIDLAENHYDCLSRHPLLETENIIICEIL